MIMRKEAVSINEEFRCGISYESQYPFLSPDYDAKYTVNEKEYIGFQTLQAVEIGTTADKHGCDCSEITVYKDSYGNNVVMLRNNIPCFDFEDREYDSAHLLFLFHNGGKVYALRCNKGYLIASLTLYEDIAISKPELRHYLRFWGFPIDDI